MARGTASAAGAVVRPVHDGSRRPRRSSASGAHGAVAGDRDHHREDPADQVGPAGGGVVVGGVVERLDGRADRAGQVGGRVVPLLQRDRANIEPEPTA